MEEKGRSRHSLQMKMPACVRRHYKRYVAFLLAFAMTFTNVGTSVNVAFAAEDTSVAVTFLLDGQDIKDAVGAAVEEGTSFDYASLELVAGSGSLEKEYEKLLGGENIYEFFPTIDSLNLPDGAELRTFFNAGTEEVIFLFINGSDQKLSFRANVDGYQTAKVTVNPNSANVEDQPVVDPGDVVMPEESTVAEESTAVEETTVAETTGTPVETDAVEETEAPKETEAPAETAAPAETDAAAETEAPVEEVPAETEAPVEEAPVEAAPVEAAPAAEGEAVAISQRSVPMVAMALTEIEGTEPEKETEVPVETTAAPVETEVVVPEETETVVPEESETVVPEETTAALEETNPVIPEEAVAEDTHPEYEDIPEDDALLEEDVVDVVGTVKGKAYNGVEILGGATARAYKVDLDELLAGIVVDGYAVNYSVDPVGSAYVDGTDSVAEGEDLTFTVEPQVGFVIVSVTANGVELELDESTQSDADSIQKTYTVAEIAEEVEIQIVMTEVSEHPAFKDSVEVNGVTITASAEEGIIPAGTELSIEEVTELVEAVVKEKIEAEEATTVTSVLAYDINLMLDGKKLNNSWAQDGSNYVTVTFSGEKISKNSQVADSAEIFFTDIKEEETLSAETVSEVTVETIELDNEGRAPIDVSGEGSTDSVEFTATHFTMYTLVYSTKAAETIKIEGDAKIAIGGTTQLSAQSSTTGRPISDVTWSSSKDAVATVDASGLVTGKTGGVTLITATKGGLTSSFGVTVQANTIAFYSNYKPDAEKFTYDNALGSGNIVRAVDTYAVYQIAPEEKTFSAIEGFSCTNYPFLGWNTEKNGSGTLYQVNDPIEVTTNLKLYGCWGEKGEATKISVNIQYNNNNKPGMTVNGILNLDKSITFQLHSQETVRATNPEEGKWLYGWEVGKNSDEIYDLGSICTTKNFTKDKGFNTYNVKAYSKYSGGVTAEFFVLKSTIENPGTITAVENYYYVGTGILEKTTTGNATIDYIKDSDKTVDEYIKTEPSPSKIANTMGIGFEEAESIRWYKIIKTGTAWHIDGMLYKVGKYWNVNYYDGGNIVKTEMVEDGSSYRILENAPEPIGADFDKWAFLDGTKVGEGAVNIFSNVNVYANYSRRYQVSFVNENKEPYDDALAVQDVKENDAATKPTFIPDNYEVEDIEYTFVKWLPAGGYTLEDLEKVTEDMIFVAEFTPMVRYTVTYDGNGNTGGVVPASKSYSVGKAVAVATDIPEKTGYQFAGWKIQTVGATVVDGKFIMPDKNVEFKAEWKPKADVTIEYKTEDANKGTVSRPSETLNPEIGNAVGSAATPKKGYVFVNWTVGTKVVSQTEVITAAEVDAVAKNAAGIYEATTFVATFEEAAAVELTYVAGDGGTVTSKGETVRPVTKPAQGSTATEKPGYSFVNWTVGTKVVSQTEVITSAEVDAVAKNEAGIYEEKTFTANFVAKTDIQYTVRHIKQDSDGKWPTDMTDELVDSQSLTGTTGVTVSAVAKDYGSSYRFNAEIVGTLVTDTVKGDGSLELKLYYNGINELTFTSKNNSMMYSGNMLVPRDRPAGPNQGDELDVTRTGGQLKGHDVLTGMKPKYPEVGITNVEESGAKNEFTLPDLKVTRDGVDVTYEYKPHYIYGTLAITPRPITITSATPASKIYDGTPLTDVRIIIGGSGFANPKGKVQEGATYNVTGTQTEVGKSDNEFTYTLNNNTLATNYEITSVPGKLEVTPAGGNTVTVEDEEVIYDGDLHSLEAPTGMKEGSTVWYSKTNPNDAGFSEETAWSQTEPTYVDAGTYPVYVKATNPNYKDTEVVKADVIIKKRNVSLTSASGSRVYTGQPLTTGNNVTIGGDTFAEGEGAVYDVTGTQTEVGKSDNTFTYSAKAGTNLNNYSITSIEGTLTVTKRTITLIANSGSKPYDGTSVTPYDRGESGYFFNEESLADDEALSEVRVTGMQLYVGTSESNIDESTVTIKDKDEKDVTENYEVICEAGKLEITQADYPITITAENAERVYNGAPLTEGEFTYESSNLEQNGDYVVAITKGSITDVGEIDNEVESVKIFHQTEERSEPVDVTENYRIKVVTGTLEITKAPAMITVNHFSKTYNTGDPTFTGAVSGLVNENDLGTVAYVRAEADKGREQVTTDTDKIQLTATYTANDNYDVTVTPGTLAITAATDNGLSVAGQSVIYDGKAYGLKSVEATKPGSALLYSTDGTNFSETVPTFTEAGTYTVYVKATNPNFADTAVTSGIVTIGKREISITAASGSKTFDGTELTHAGTIITGGTLAPNQTLTGVKVTGAQRTVGTSANVPSDAVIQMAGQDVTANYTIQYLNGTLTVTSAGGNNPGGGGNPGGTDPDNGPGVNPDGPITIDPGEVPLANLPNGMGSGAGSIDNLFIIDDGEVPLAALPKTGNPLGASALMLFFSGIMLAAYAAIGKKKEED